MVIAYGRSVNMRRKLVVILLVGAVAVGYWKSAEVYGFYMRFYYQMILKKSKDELIAEARELLVKKNYPALAKSIRTLALVYPENREIKKIQAMGLIKTGEKQRGVEILLSMVDEEKIPPAVLEEVIMTMFDDRRYADIILVLAANDHQDNPTILYCLGVSHFETGNWRAAAATLALAVREGRTDARARFYLGRALIETGRLAEGIPHLEDAYRANDRDKDVAEALMLAYRKAGRIKEADALLRRRL